MKLQDVILKAMAKKIRWLEAAEIDGVTDRAAKEFSKQDILTCYRQTCC